MNRRFLNAVLILMMTCSVATKCSGWSEPLYIDSDWKVYAPVGEWAIIDAWVTSGGPVYSWVWSWGGYQSQSDDDYSSMSWGQYDSPGVYNAYVDAYSDGGSDDSHSYVYAVAVTQVASGGSYLCVGDQMTFGAITNPPNCASYVTVTWSGGGTPSTGSGSLFTTNWSTPGLKTVTATCGTSSAQKQVTVVEPKMVFKVGGVESGSITRAQSGTFEVVDENGNPMGGYASYSGWVFCGTVMNVSEPTNTSRTWSGVMVQSGDAHCYVTINGHQIQVEEGITVSNRGWSLSPSFSPDAVSNFGGFPGTPEADNCCYYTESGDILQPKANDWEDAYVPGVVESGPNKDVWYISSTSLVSWHMSRIGKFLKPGATGYPPGPENGWYEENAVRQVDIAGCLQGIKNHEAYGTGGNRKGHQAFLEDTEALSGNDARTEIEDNVEASLEALDSITIPEISDIESTIYGEYSQEPSSGDNWGPSTAYFFNFTTYIWDPMTWGF